jgi:hypothetical protein
MPPIRPIVVHGLQHLTGKADMLPEQRDTLFAGNLPSKHLKRRVFMLRKLTLVVTVFLMGLVLLAPSIAQAAPGAPNFGPSLYADGEVWGTKGTTALPAPNGHNGQSFDKLFVITNSNNPDGQLPVGEAAPGNPNYNGGRWFTHTVEWTPAGFADHGTTPVLTSYDDIMVHWLLGHLTITPGSPEDGPPPYFQCPLLPVK